MALVCIQFFGAAFEEVKVPTEKIFKQKEIQRAWVTETAKEWPLLIALYDHVHEQIFKLPYFKQ